MNNLLDTHTLIWYLNGDNECSKNARECIEESETKNYISIASLWEIAIKVSLNKLVLNAPFEALLLQLKRNGFLLLGITFNDTLTLTQLPFYHKDPFDRLMIAQSINNSLRLITKDSVFQAYSVEIAW